MKKTNKKLVLNVLFNCLAGVLIAFALGINPVVGAVAVNAAGVVLNYADNMVQALFAGLAKEVWLPLVMEDPYPKASFLNAATNMTSLVDNDKINFAEAGIDPNVLVNNTVYPVPMVDAADLPKSVELKYYDTENTVVRNAIQKELVYDQRALYANKHKKALAKKIGMDAAYMYAPQEADATKNNYLIKLGANDSVIDGIIDLSAKFLDLDIDPGEMNLVLNAFHEAEIAKENKELYKAIMAEPGSVFYNFRIWRYGKNPIYITATDQKAAYGAAYVSGTHSRSSFAFLTSEVMVADGSADMFSRLADPQHRGDIFGFQKRALATTLRGKYSGAILK